MNTMRSRRSARRCAPRAESFEPRTLLTLLGGGFESPALTTAGYYGFRYGPTGTAWTYTADAAGVAADGSAFTSSNPTAPEGRQVAFLKRTGTISQLFTSDAAGSYELRFQAAQRGNWSGPQDFRVEVDGVVVGSFDARQTTYRPMSTAVFDLTAGAHRITFRGVNSRGGDNTALLDDVRLVDVTPAAVGLMEGGFESPALTTAGYYGFRYGPTGTAWTYTADAAGVAADGSAFTSSNPTAPEGRQVAFLKRTGTISQLFTSDAAGSYEVRFQAAQRGNWSGPQDFQVEVDGVVVGTFDANQSTYSNLRTRVFNLTAGAHRITFRGINSLGGDNTVLLDDVRLAAPTTTGLMEGGFESPALTTAGYYGFRYGPTGTAWTYTADAAGVAADGSAFTSSNPAAPEGRQVAFLKRTGSISQVAAGLDAGTYRIRFQAAQRGNWSGPQDFQVEVDGVVVGTFDARQTTYRWMYTNTFTVAAGAHTVAFRGVNSRGGDNTVLLDDVRLERSESFATAATGATLAAVNIEANGFWTAGPTWTDVTRLIVGWGRYTSPWSIDPTIPLDDRGYPMVDAAAGTPMIGYPTGNYTLSYEGTGEVTIAGLGRLVGGISTAAGVRRGTVLIDRTYESSGSQLYIHIRNVNPSDPIRNLRLIAPGYDVDDPPTFANEFLDRVRPFSTLRFMDWFTTNNSTLTNWSDRTAPGSFLQGTSKGVAYEHAIDLANAARKDLWLNVPARATDDYIRRLADLVRDRLDPDLNVYLEYSNEVWNYYFRQWGDVLAIARANPLITATGDYERVAQQTALRTVEIGRIFRQQFGDRAEQIRPVFSGQSAWTHFLSTGLSYLASRFGRPSDELFGMAIAPYYTVPGTGAAGLTLDGFFSAVATVPDQIRDAVARNKPLADLYRLPLMSYEGGLALTTEGGLNRAVKRAALEDPRMATLSRDAYAAWIAGGGEMFTQYTLASRPADWGAWGLLPTMGRVGSPRYDGMMAAFLTAGDADRDADVDFDDYRILAANFRRPGRLWWSQGDFNLDNLVNDADLEILRKNVRGLTPDQAAEVALLGLPGTSAVNATWAMRGVRDPALQVSWRIERAGVLMATASNAMFDWRPPAAGTYTILTTARRADGTTATRSHTIVVG